MYYKVLILVSLLNFVYSANIQCNQQSIDKLDDNVMKGAILGDPNRKYPNKDEVHRHCRQDNEITTWGSEYAKQCLPKDGTSRYITTLLMSSIRKVSNRRCKTDITRNRFVETGKCGNLHKTETEKCWKKYIMDTEKVNKAKKAAIKNEKHFFPLICCAYHNFHDCCVEVWTKNHYSKPCDRKAVQELETYINDSMYDVIQYLCGDYQENNDKCDRLLASYKDILNNVKIKSNSIPKSPLSGSNQIFDSIPPL